MTVMIQEPHPELAPSACDVPGHGFRGQVVGLLKAMYPENALPERRRENRYPFPYLVHLTPVDENGEASSNETIVVVGKHISERGLGFFHPAPLAYRNMIASVEGADGQWLGFLIDLSWCRFTKQGWYESGGRFLRAIEPIVKLTK